MVLYPTATLTLHLCSEFGVSLLVTFLLIFLKRLLVEFIMAGITLTSGLMPDLVVNLVN